MKAMSFYFYFRPEWHKMAELKWKSRSKITFWLIWSWERGKEICCRSEEEEKMVEHVVKVIITQHTWIAFLKWNLLGNMVPEGI